MLELYMLLFLGLILTAVLPCFSIKRKYELRIRRLNNINRIAKGNRRR